MNIISPYAAENMYWNRINMEMSNNMYQRDQEDYYEDYDNSTPDGDSKQGIITILVVFMYFFLMMLALSSLLNNHY